LRQSVTEYEQRRNYLVSALTGRKLDAAIVTSLPNLRYLTGFTGSNGVLLLASDTTLFITDPRYGLQAAQQTTCSVTVARGKLLEKLAKRVGRVRKIGFEDARMNVQSHQLLKEKLPLGASLEPLGTLLEDLRMVKSETEIEAIRRSVAANSKAFDRGLRKVKAGIRESDLALELDSAMRRLGADHPAFDTIVAFGTHSALPHAQPGTKALAPDQLVLIDMGASLEGYASDMTRMAHLGAPPKRIRRMYRAVLEAQQAAIDAVRPGVTAASVDRAARQTLKSFKLDREFMHSTGHGLGLEIHEPPRLGRKEKTKLQAGMVVTIEPGAYVEGVGGIRIEDTVLVTERGCEILTPTSKELVVL
jgi:Xaa-Pro aminopeptidase